jgi:CTP:molybdopterin cytidylyltransferase MocA/SAM-dependent methyltransferase
VSKLATAIVLAAGAGQRFGGGKLLAPIDGRPILQHVLDALAGAGIEDPVVVVGADAAALDFVIEWRGARRVANPAPERGLSSSLQLGWAAAMGAQPGPGAVLVVLGDQPSLDPDVIRTLLAQPVDPARPVVVARYADGARNPVRLEPEAGDLVRAATGDRGLGPLLAARPELVRIVEVGGTNPDVDRPADLVALVADAWARRVRENAAQVERIRETPDGRDFYATVSRTFVADPARQEDPVLEALLSHARPGETWLDIGAGAGRYALPIARHVREVVAVDPSTSMLEALRAGMAAHGITGIRTVEGRWPPDGVLRATLGPDPIADVALIAHVGYDVEAIVPFLDAMEAAAGRLCVAVLMEGSPASVAAPFWPLVHGEMRVPLPALPQLVELLGARGSQPRVTRVTGERRRWADREELITFLRRQLWTAPGSPADARLLEVLEDMAVVADDATTGVPAAPALDTGIVSWAPGEQGWGLVRRVEASGPA